MSKRILSSAKMAVTKNKNKNTVLSCSTPEHQIDSPTRESDYLCDSEAGSPVPFLCTQDGTDGETDVVWNYYTPKSDNKANRRVKNSTPLSRKERRPEKTKLKEELPKRKTLRSHTQKRSEFYKDLLELNQNLYQLIAKKSQSEIKDTHSGSEDDIFSDAAEISPKNGIRNSSRCLRKNLLSSKFHKPDAEPALESDDSMNECLIKASQFVEEKLNSETSSPKRPSIKIMHAQHSPKFPEIGQCPSPILNNDTFDNLVGNLNDSALEMLTQMPVQTNVSSSKKQGSDWMVKELVIHEGSPKIGFNRHSSMPESPTFNVDNKPSTSGMAFGRYSSMPFNKECNFDNEDSPIKCTPDEIKRKHLQAREKLLAKRLPFTSQCTQFQSTQQVQQTKKQFQPRVPSNSGQNPVNTNNNKLRMSAVNHGIKTDKLEDLRSIIEKKRQEALMKLRRRQNSNKLLR